MSTRRPQYCSIKVSGQNPRYPSRPGMMFTSVPSPSVPYIIGELEIDSYEWRIDSYL